MLHEAKRFLRGCLLCGAAALCACGQPTEPRSSMTPAPTRPDAAAGSPLPNDETAIPEFTPSMTAIAVPAEATLPPATQPLAATAEIASTAIPEVTGAPKDFVTVKGTELQLNGQPHTLLGFNRYDLLTEEGSGCGDQFADDDLEKWFSELQAMGANTARLWAAPDYVLNGYGRLDKVIAAAKAHEVKLVLTLDNEWSTCKMEEPEGTVDPSDGRKNSEWYTHGYKEVPKSGPTVSYKDHAIALVEHIKGNDAVAVIELLNEPESTDAQALYDFVEDMTTTIKQIDPDHLISIGTIGGGQPGTDNDNFRKLAQIKGVDIISIHDYDPTPTIPGDQWNGPAIDIQIAKEVGKPFFLGELGTDQLPPAERAKVERQKMEAYLQQGAVGFLFWSGRPARNAHVGDFDIGVNDPLNEVIKEEATTIFSAK